MTEYNREPCPIRILDDIGGAFTMGLLGGSVFHSIKGFRNAPSGFNRRMVSVNLGLRVFFLQKLLFSRTKISIFTLFLFEKKKNHRKF